MTTVFSETELARASSYHREEDRRRFVTACWMLRTVAAAQLGVNPRAVRIDRRCTECGRPHGKPRLLADGTALEVSVSHSGNRVAVALSTGGPVGIDVEELAPDPAGVPQLALSPAELKRLQALPPQDQELGFITMWVRKEAVLKATGHGLRIPPDQVEVSGPREDPALFGWPLDIAPAAVDLRTLDPGDGYAAVVALLADGHPVKVSEIQFTPLSQRDSDAAAINAA